MAKLRRPSDPCHKAENFTLSSVGSTRVLMESKPGKADGESLLNGRWLRKGAICSHRELLGIRDQGLGWLQRFNIADHRLAQGSATLNT